MQPLLTLTLSYLTIWYFRQTSLFLFLLAKVALASLPTALSVALRALFPFQEVQYAQVFLGKPVPFCKLFAGLGSTNKSATSLLLHLFFYLNLSGRSGSYCLLSFFVLSGYSGALNTYFSLGMTWLISWPYLEHYLCPLQSLVVSLLLSLVFTLLRLGVYCLIENL